MVEPEVTRTQYILQAMLRTTIALSDVFVANPSSCLFFFCSFLLIVPKCAAPRADSQLCVSRVRCVGQTHTINLTTKSSDSFLPSIELFVYARILRLVPMHPHHRQPSSESRDRGSRTRK